MSWNGCKVIDMDAHIVERPERMYQEYIDPAYREPYAATLHGNRQAN